METVQNENITLQNEMEQIHTITDSEQAARLTASELSNLWSAYVANTLWECQTKYFLRVVEDHETNQVLEFLHGVAQKHLNFLTELYKLENHPIPHGLRVAEDINLDAPRLFTDSFILQHLEDIAKINTDGYNTALTQCSRPDVRQFFTKGYADQAGLYNKTINIMQSKGIYARPPYTPIPERFDFVKKQNFLAGYLRKRRPLTSTEISHIYSGLSRSYYRRNLLTGYAQVAKSEQVRKYMNKGRKISHKHIQILSTLLIKNGLPISTAWDPGVMDSKISPFSERLMMENVRSSNVEMIGTLGKAVSVVALRHDLGVNTAHLLVDINDLSEDGVNILIDNGWLQEPPMAKDPNAPVLH